MCSLCKAQTFLTIPTHCNVCYAWIQIAPFQGTSQSFVIKLALKIPGCIFDTRIS